jgi:hypothetical protein
MLAELDASVASTTKWFVVVDAPEVGGVGYLAAFSPRIYVQYATILWVSQGSSIVVRGRIFIEIANSRRTTEAN